MLKGLLIYILSSNLCIFKMQLYQSAIELRSSHWPPVQFIEFHAQFGYSHKCKIAILILSVVILFHPYNFAIFITFVCF